jgi:hypothetical protein
MGMQGCAWACPAAARLPESRGNAPRLQRKGGQRWVQLRITLINKKIQSGAVEKSYMRKSFLIYEEMRKCFPIYEEAVSHI